MKVTVAKADLERALAVTGNTVAATGDDISQDFVFRHHDGGVEVLSYNQSFFSSSPLICTVEDLQDNADLNRFTVESKRLRQWVGAVDHAVLDFEYDHKGVVTASSPRGSVKFRSKDPASFPFWDKTLSEAETTAEVPAGHLSAALSYAKHFVSTNETKEPHLCNCQFRDGFLYATDNAVAVGIEVKGMKKSNLRVPGKEIAKACKFLDVAGGNIKVKEHKRGFFLCAPDGQVFGSERQGKPFPGLKGFGKAYEKSERWWTLDKNEVLSSLEILTSSANFEDPYHLSHYRTLDDESLLEMSLMSATGETVDITCPLVKVETKDGAKDLPEEGFPLSYKRLSKIVGLYSQDEVVMAVAAFKKGGWVAFYEEVDEMKRLTVLSWTLNRRGS